MDLGSRSWLDEPLSIELTSTELMIELDPGMAEELLPPTEPAPHLVG